MVFKSTVWVNVHLILNQINHHGLQNVKNESSQVQLDFKLKFLLSILPVCPCSNFHIKYGNVMKAVQAMSN